VLEVVEHWRTRVFDAKSPDVQQPLVGGSEHFVKILLEPEDMKSNISVEVRQHKSVKLLRDATDISHV
jgi:hypothetical protein